MAPQPGVNGVLPASVLQKNAPASAPRGPKAAQPRLKLVLRRLPPGLTKIEFEALLGNEWKLGGGKIDYLRYQKGKISRDQAKPSRPSRVYIHVTSQSHVPMLGDHVRHTSFHDTAKSFQDSALLGPPTLEYAPYHRLPGGRRKHDNRQGTIDQDQEFKDFLESLTNPITKPAAPEADTTEKVEKVKTTPLIESLREKRANKDKPQVKGGKHARGEPKEDSSEKKILSKQGKDNAAGSGEKARKLTKAEKAATAKDAVKLLNREAAAKNAPPSVSEKNTPASPSPAPERKRGNASIAKSMLQRDLGIGPGASRGRRGAKRELIAAANSDVAGQVQENMANKSKGKDNTSSAPTHETSEKTNPASPKKPSRADRRAGKANLNDKTNTRNTTEDSKQSTKAPASVPPTILKKASATSSSAAAPKGPATSRLPPTEPAASRAALAQQQPSPANNETNLQARSQASTAPSSSGATGKQAFLKHANPSQGITEPLIEEALKVFGTIDKVEIDKRKGFAYVDFADPEGLQKAIAGSPVKIAQGAVQVLERKEKVVRNRPHIGPLGPPTGPVRGGRGGFPPRGRGRGAARGGGHAVANPANDTAQAASSAMSTVT